MPNDSHGIDPQVALFLSELLGSLKTEQGFEAALEIAKNQAIDKQYGTERPDVPTMITGKADCNGITITLDKNEISSQNTQLHNMMFAINTMVKNTDETDTVPNARITSSSTTELTIPTKTIQHLKEKELIKTVPKDLRDCQSAFLGIEHDKGATTDIIQSPTPNGSTQTLGRA